jgi:hypothetical protein
VSRLEISSHALNVLESACSRTGRDIGPLSLRTEHSFREQARSHEIEERLEISSDGQGVWECSHGIEERLEISSDGQDVWECSHRIEEQLEISSHAQDVWE